MKRRTFPKTIAGFFAGLFGVKAAEAGAKPLRLFVDLDDVRVVKPPACPVCGSWDTDFHPVLGLATCQTCWWNFTEAARRPLPIVISEKQADSFADAVNHEPNPGRWRIDKEIGQVFFNEKTVAVIARKLPYNAPDNP